MSLPSAILDLTLFRMSALSSRLTLSRRCFNSTQRLQNTEALTAPTPPFGESLQNVVLKTRGRKRTPLGGLALRPKRAHPAQELEHRIQALQNLLISLSQETTIEQLFYPEQDLAAFYQDVLAAAPETDNFRIDEQAVRRALAAEDVLILKCMYQRFDIASDANSPYHTVLSRLDSIVSRLESAHRITVAELANAEQHLFPVSILTLRECEALVRACIKSKDAHSAESALGLMKRTGLTVPVIAITDVLRLYSNSGNAALADQLLAKFLTEPPTELQRHLHISAHLNPMSSTSMPTSALDLLHAYEAKALPAPMYTYTSLITSLFSVPSSIARAQAWDLFSHMRYVAHPDPDVLLYTLMIRACASPLSSTVASEPEKALDLWTEMTVDHRLEPTVGAYNAVILACARSGTKEFVAEAFRIARQMLDSNRDAEGRSAYRPDRKTFCALLEGAKRTGDLGRVRWILAEMVGSKGDRDEVNGPVDVKVDEEVMLHVFNAYAAYRPPFQRAETKVVESNQDRGHSSVTSQPTSSTETAIISSPHNPEISSGELEPQIALNGEPPSFLQLPPQSHTEVLHEARFLFECIRNAQPNSSTSHHPTSAPFAYQKFTGVGLTTRLVNAHMSIHYNHASLATSRELFWTLYEDLGLTRSARTYIEALERCGNARKGQERVIALQFADELWARWMRIEAAGKMDGRKLNARMIERANVAMVRVLTLVNKFDRAMDIVRAFGYRYDPGTIRTPVQKPALRSTRTVLVASRPLVRLTSVVDVPDDQVPPFLSFKDVEILHHRLVAHGKYKDIGYLKWLCKAYEWALRVRRDESTRLSPEQPDKALVIVD